jgi:hypothetical protein
VTHDVRSGVKLDATAYYQFNIEDGLHRYQGNPDETNMPIFFGADL